MELTDNANKKDINDKISEYYQNKLNIVMKQNHNLRKYALDIPAGGGFVDTLRARGVIRKDFQTPYQQSLIAEEMANEGYFALALKQFTSLCRSVKVELTYKNKELLSDPKHREVLDFIQSEINNIGGYDNIFSKVIEPALRSGVGIGLPELTRVGKKRDKIGFKNLRNINLQNIQRFLFDPNDTTKVRAMSYITYPKQIDTGIDIKEAYDSDELSYPKEDITKTKLITIDLDSNCIAYHAHNAQDGNPFGTFYLYYLYSYYKQYKKINESMYNALHSFGTYPMGVKRTARDSGADNQEWEINSTNKLMDIISQGGGVYVDGEGELYNLTPPDTEMMTNSMQGLFDIVMRTASLGQVTTGIQGGGSRDLMRSLDIFTDSFVLSTIKSSCLDISETMIKALCKLNFGKLYRTGKLIEYPRLIPEDNNEIIVSELDKAEKAAEKESKEESIKQSMYISDDNDNNGSKELPYKHIEESPYKSSFNIIKQKLNHLEAVIIVDTFSLDKMLTDKTNELSEILAISLKPKIKKALEIISQNPKTNLNIWGINDKKELRSNIKSALSNVVMSSQLEQVKFLVEAYKLGNTTFEETLQTDPITWANKITEKYIKESVFNTVLDITINQATEYVRNYAVNIQDSFSVQSNPQALSDMLRRAVGNASNLKASDFENIALKAVIKTFINSSCLNNSESVKKSKDNYVMVRSGIFENSPSHCSPIIGKVYYPDENGVFFDYEGREAIFPDPDYVSMDNSKSCRCFGILTPKGIIGT